MSVRDGLKLVFRNLYSRKGRTILTALGVAIGTAAIIGMISLAIGLKASAMQSFEDFQDITVLQVHPDYSESYGGYMNTSIITQQGVEQVKQIPSVAGVMPINRVWADLEVQLGRRVGYASLIGIDATDSSAFNFKLDEGVFLSGSKSEAVVTYPVPLQMQEKKRASRNNKDDPGMYYDPYMSSDSMQKTDMLNKTITLSVRKHTSDGEFEKRDYRVKVVGVLSEGQGEWGPAIYLSMDMLNDIKKWLGQNGSDTIGRANRDEVIYESMQVKVASRELVEEAVEEIRMLGYQTWSPTESLKEINRFFMILQLILGGIGAISLLVASIGIMNTMFMSILERTKEIGIMKVLGANIPDIKKLFLVESGTIGLMGGLGGLLTGHAVAAIINFIARHTAGGGIYGQVDKIAIIPIWLSIFAIAFAIFIGVVSGYLPANRAASISPLQAIRNE